MFLSTCICLNASQGNLLLTQIMQSYRTLFSLAYDLMTKRLTKILKTAPNMNYLELTTLAIQDMLRCHLAVPGSMPKGSKRKAQTLSLFDALPKETQALIRPYLESKYSMTSSGRKPTGRVFSKDISFRRWLGLWLTQLTESLEQGRAGLSMNDQLV